MLHVIISVLAFFVAIGILVAFHEFGHFWVARKLNVKVLRFSVGLGKVIWSRRAKDGTEYAISAIPLGGYVKMLDEREGDVPDSEKHLAFNNQHVLKRIAIVLAGPVFNFIFAIAAFWAMNLIGYTKPIPIVGYVTPQSIAANAGFEYKDEILSVDNIDTPSWTEIVRALIPHLSDDYDIPIVVKRDVLRQNLSLNLRDWSMQTRNQDLLDSIGISTFYMPVAPLIEDVNKDEPAYTADLRKGDLITHVEGEKVSDWQQFVNIIKISPLRELDLTVLRDNQELDLKIIPRLKSSLTGESKGYIGVQVALEPLADKYKRHYSMSLIGGLTDALSKTWGFTTMTFVVLGKMITGQIGLENISGPVTIAQGAGATAVSGITYFLGFLGIISVSLAVLNLLPIPILDGGHLLYYLIELITGKPVSVKTQIVGFKIGVFILIFIMTVAFYNDIIRLL